jgi:hypothetical protein
MTSFAPAPDSCPVCARLVRAGAVRCSTCQTELTKWWPLRESLIQADVLIRARPGHSRPRWVFWAALWASALLCTAVAVFLVVVIWPRADQGGANEPAPERSTTEVRVESLPFAVRPGDTLWTLSHSLTGRGENWGLLWPEWVGKERQIGVGTTLRISLERVTRLSEDNESQEIAVE